MHPPEVIHIENLIRPGILNVFGLENHRFPRQRTHGIIMAMTRLVPVLRVADVARSMQWYRDTLALAGDPFPAKPPYEFAILRQGQVELMLRRGSPPSRTAPRQYDWDVYLRREGDRFRDVFAAFNARGIVTRRLEQMPYGLAEFEVTDPDGYVICLSQHLDDASDLPSPTA
jgi:catechol 2,3-dioxygenase-like lactoylglutathione lyase family enzyme